VGAGRDQLGTGEQRTLATRTDEGFMKFAAHPAGYTVKLTRGLRTARQATEELWVADGRLWAYDAARPPPFAPRAVAPRTPPLPGAPELDLRDLAPTGDGTGTVRWRPDARAAWREARFHVAHTEPVAIDSLVALPDGGLLGGATQYHGFFRFDPGDRSVRPYPAIGISGGPRTVVGDRVYLAGYPNGVLYVYDPRRAWTATREPAPDANPRHLGNFAQAGAHYAYFLEPAANGRLYYVGRRERDGVGTGVGSYDPATARFAGHHDGLDDFDPRGAVVVGDPPTLVVAGRARGVADAPLVLFDAELRPRGRQLVRPGIRDTGLLFPTADPRVVIGVSATDGAIYRHDLGTGGALTYHPLSGPVLGAAQRPADRSIWLVLGGSLWRFDAATLEAERVRELPAPPAGPGLLVWQGDRLFWACQSELRALAVP
jgi:hypothetical protein